MELSPTDQFVVETPENIRFGYDVADIGSRFLAILIDTLIQGVIYILFAIAAIVLGNGFTQMDLPRWLVDASVILLLLALFLIQFGYFLFFEIFLNGATPGKRLFHLRVIKDNGYPLSPMDAIIRNMVRVIDFFPFAYGVGVIVMFSNTRAKRLGDYAAGTIVVKMRDELRLHHLTPVTNVAPPSAEAQAQTRQLNEADIALAENFLNRRAQMTNPSKMTLDIALRLATKMQLPESAKPATVDSALTFIRNTIAAYRTPRG